MILKWNDKILCGRIIAMRLSELLKFNEIVIQFGQQITDFSQDEKEIAHELQHQVNFMKKSRSTAQLIPIIIFRE